MIRAVILAAVEQRFGNTVVNSTHRVADGQGFGIHLASLASSASSADHAGMVAAKQWHDRVIHSKIDEAHPSRLHGQALTRQRRSSVWESHSNTEMSATRVRKSCDIFNLTVSECPEIHLQLR